MVSDSNSNLELLWDSVVFSHYVWQWVKRSRAVTGVVASHGMRRLYAVNVFTRNVRHSKCAAMFVRLQQVKANQQSLFENSWRTSVNMCSFSCHLYKQNRYECSKAGCFMCYIINLQSYCGWLDSESGDPLCKLKQNKWSLCVIHSQSFFFLRLLCLNSRRITNLK